MVKKNILNRRMTSPILFTDEKVTDVEINEMLDVARWAPTHKMTQPWRYAVVRGKALDRFAQFVETQYKNKENPLSGKKLEKKVFKVKKAQAIIIILRRRDPEERIPEWEETAAVACSVENMWIYACNMGMGGYWSTPFFIENMAEFTPLHDGEKCMGIFYLGKVPSDMPDVRKRKSVDEIARWIRD